MILSGLWGHGWLPRKFGWKENKAGYDQFQGLTQDDAKIDGLILQKN
jgi:hypothetical protein